MTPPTPPADVEEDRGQNTGLHTAECEVCAHPLSGRTKAALWAAFRDHQQRPRPAD